MLFVVYVLKEATAQQFLELMWNLQHLAQLLRVVEL